MADRSQHHLSPGSNPSEPSDSELTPGNVELGMFVRQDKYAKVYSVVTSKRESAEWEAHVFDITKKQARFLERMVWPKMRKSNNYKTDFTRASTRIFIQRVADEIKTTGTTCTKVKRGKTGLPGMDAAISSIGSTGNGIPDPVEFVRYLFALYCVRKGDRLPIFKGGNYQQNPTPSGSFQKFSADHSFKKMWIDLWHNESIPTDKQAEQEGNGMNPTEIFGTPSASAGGRKSPCRSSARPFPLDRDLATILDLARMINEECIIRHPTGYSPPALKSFAEYLAPRAHSTEKSMLEALASKNQDWTDRLDRLNERIPKILDKLTKQRAATWRASIPRVFFVLHVHKGKLNSRWPTILRWMFEYGFEGFDSMAVQAVVNGLLAGHTPTTALWLLRIQSHEALYQWADREMKKTSKEPGAPDATLMQMLHAHARRELVIGMVPVLQRMR
ncbi:hypothetical protein PG990_014252 [Apiospora arundinis]